MPEKFQQKYRVSSARLQHWNYGSNACYFVTVCTKNREHFFGEITNGIVLLSEIGKWIETEWLKTFEIRKDMNLQMGEYVIMPNHFHAIITIGTNKYNIKTIDYFEIIDDCKTVDDAINNVNGDAGENIYKNQFGPQSKNLASIIRGFKSTVTKYARIHHIPFAWQPGFYEHIIRNEESFQKITNYIANNPANWQDDKFFSNKF